MTFKKLMGSIAATGLALFSLGVATMTQAAAKSSSSYAVTTRQVKSGKVTLPKNTRVAISYKTTKKHIVYARLDLSNMSYKIRHQTTSKAVTVRYTANFKATKSNSNLEKLLAKGKAYTNQTSFTKAPKLHFTTDQYVEYFANGNTNSRPTSSTKITAIKKNGNLIHYYAKKNMLKLPDKRISKKGNYQYRLAVRINPNIAKDLSRSYSVGSVKNYFYLPTFRA
ncbi:hypothetical protein [Secundilactobacillus folii]|uniref:Extracellular protein n=1 Tax=Secundilactobacillus folii TaxID=2678357 RepID=A0A7X3C2G0_9LACO|nr:hypothetical protein [Secundilactobacillus folii]MTV82815.1 hypothetical protein [Secundilactobacillus folii]